MFNTNHRPNLNRNFTCEKIRYHFLYIAITNVDAPPRRRDLLDGGGHQNGMVASEGETVTRGRLITDTSHRGVARR